MGKTTLKPGWGSEPLPQRLLPITPSPSGACSTIPWNTRCCPNESPNRTQQGCLVTEATGARSSQKPHGNSHSLPQSWGKGRGEKDVLKKTKQKAPGFWAGVKCKNSGAPSYNTLQATQHSPHGPRWPWTTIHLHSHLEGAWLTRVFAKGNNTEPFACLGDMLCVLLHIWQGCSIKKVMECLWLSFQSTG